MIKKKTLMILLGIKIGIFCFYFIFLPSRRLAGNEWFNMTKTTDEIINFIKAKKHDIDMYDSSGKTGLMVFIGRGDVEVVKAFIAAGANLDKQASDETGDTALLIACYNGSFPKMMTIIELLVNAGARVDVANKRGETPLHHAMQITNLKDRQKVMSLLVNHQPIGANVNAQDINGMTILHLAVANKDDYGVEMLLDTFGSLLDFNIKNGKEGLTPVAYARLLGFFTLAKRIEKGMMRLTKK